MDDDEGNTEEPNRKKKKHALVELLGDQFLDTDTEVPEAMNTSRAHKDLVQSEILLNLLLLLTSAH